jgi:predicted nucleotidyltransferase
MLTALRRNLNAATQFAPFRVPTVFLIRALTGVSCRLLGKSGSVVAVYLRGSYGRGDFRPYISDIDLAIAVRRPPPGRGYDLCRSLHRRLRLVRTLNPFVRDVWQTIVTEPQWPLVGRYGYLYATEDWRLIIGNEPWSAPSPVDERLLLAASWNRQHFWTALAVQQAQQGKTALRGLEGSLKKAGSFARKIERADGSRAGEGPLSLPVALYELTQSAERLMHRLDLSTFRRIHQGAEAELDQPTPKESRALREISGSIDLERDIIAVVSVEGFLVLVTEREWTVQDYAAVQDLLSRVYQLTRMVTLIHSEKSFALAPLWRGMRVLRRGDGITSLPEPLLLPEQLLYQSLYIGTHLWVAPGRHNPRRTLEVHVGSALELYGYFLAGRLPSAKHSAREALAELTALDPEITARLQQVPGLPAHLSGESELDASDLFELGSIVAERLAEFLVAPTGVDLPDLAPAL